MNCGRGTLTRAHPTKPRTYQYLAAKCHRLTCPECGPIKARQYKAAVRQLAQTHKLQRHLTLTLDPDKIPEGMTSLDHIQQVWQRFRTYLHDKRDLKLTYVRVVEWQQNGTAHYHVLIHETVTQDTLLQAWVACGGGHQVRIRFRDGARGAKYITKYITKELLRAVPKGRRRISCARGLRLFEPRQPAGWQWSRMSFIDHVALALCIPWAQAYLTTISDYFEHESPPDDCIEETLYPKKGTNAQ